MSALPTRRETFVAALAGFTAVAASYAAAGSSPTFVAAPVDQLIVNLTPGPIVTFFIENVGEEAHLLHLAGAIGVVAGLFGLVSLAALRLGRRVDRPIVGALAAGAGAWAATAALTAEPVLALAPAAPAALFTGIGGTESPTAPVDLTRRRTLGTVAGAVGVAGASAIAGQQLHDEAALGAAPEATGAEARMRDAEAAGLDVASDDLHGLVSSIEEFYNVDIAEFDPEVTAEEWSLTFTGDVETERTITYDELTDREAEHRLVSLRCVGESLNGRKLDTAVWTGTPLRPLLEAADPQGECDCAMLRGEDDYFVQFPVDVLAEGFLVWGMNGRTLPTSHGHPVRVLIPGHWGETNVKWLTEIEMLEEAEDGYWEQRGWEGTGPVNTVAKLWEEGISDLGDGRIELAGHAYAGTRGIRRVEVSVDGGDTWTDAELSDPLPDADVWRQWRHTFEPDGTHEVVVRATDGEGELQPETESDPSPSGSSGWVRTTVSE